jgi:hypothetical protein
MHIIGKVSTSLYETKIMILVVTRYYLVLMWFWRLKPSLKKNQWNKIVFLVSYKNVPSQGPAPLYKNTYVYMYIYIVTPVKSNIMLLYVAKVVVFFIKHNHFSWDSLFLPNWKKVLGRYENKISKKNAKVTDLITNFEQSWNC